MLVIISCTQDKYSVIYALGPVQTEGLKFLNPQTNKDSQLNILQPSPEKDEYYLFL